MNTNMKWILPSSLCWLLIGLWSMTVVSAGNEEAKFVFCYGTNPLNPLNKTYELKDAVQILNHPKFVLNRPTVLYVHGYVETPMSPTVQKIIDAYTIRATHNILILDWSLVARWFYPIAVLKTSELGSTIAGIFVELFDEGLPPANLHIVGHSLGAHLAGHIARMITKESDGDIKLQRISGLDPAYPLFYPAIGGTGAISDKDAVLVDIIHTNGGLYGTPFSTGSVDFWTNRGTRTQPGCPPLSLLGVLGIPLNDRDLCSHQRSVTLWAESVSNPTSTFFATNRKYKSIVAQMGINCAMNATPGNYDLSTNADYPYSKST